MTDTSKPSEATEPPEQPSAETVARWNDEGGSVPPPVDADRIEGSEQSHELGNVELVQLRIRVIAMENMLVALLSDVSEGQLAKVRARADQIMPRPGQTPHPLTTSAAAHMLSLLRRAEDWTSEAADAQSPQDGDQR